MDRTMKYMGAGQCPDDMMMSPPAEVPIGWQRRLHQGGVVYISPSGSVLACLQQAKSYLLTDGTCKCGLECPLILHKVFNFDPGAVVRQRTAEDARADADVTKLCIHKRKIIAVATLHKSMESQLPAAAAATGGGHGGSHAGSLNHQAIRNEMHNGLSNCVTPDGNSSYKMTMSGQQQHYQHDLGSPPQRDPYAAAAVAAQSRSRLGAAARRSPFSGRHGSLLSPPSSASRGSQRCGDGTPSPRPDSLRSPDPSSVLAFHRALSPGSGHVNGERFTPLSPPGIMVHGSPSGTQPPCALTARSSVSLSPSLHTKSPGRRKSPCNFNTQIVDYQQKASSVCHAQQQQHPPLSQLPSCVIQKKQVTTSEKDPLGILDPIPSKSHVLDQIAVPPPPSHIQFNAQPQVPSVNVNFPPAIVPLPSNLPLPTAKPGTAGHGLRLQHVNPSSVSPSPITSPVHLAHGPALARAEEASQHSHASVSFAQHGSALAAGPRLHSRSPRPSVPLHHLKEPAVHLRGGVSRNLDSMRPPPGPPGSDGVGQNSLSSRGVASHQQLLNPQNPSFPASSLLSAAAKAQLVNQNKLTNDSVPGGAEGLGPPGLMEGLGPPGLMGGGEQQMYMEGGGGYGGISAPGPTARSEGQSGRAALRDKLMSQQREAALRKRKHPDDAGALVGGGGDGPFNMSAQRVGVASKPSSSRYPEPMKRMMQQGGGSTPMAHLLQSMSHQSAQNGLSHAGHHHHHHHHHHSAVRSGKSPFFEESVPPPPMSTLQQSGVAPPPPSHQLHHGRVDVPAGFQDLSNKRTLNPGAPPPPPPPPPPPLSMDQFTDPLSQMYEPGFGGGSAGAAAAGFGGHNKAIMGPMDGLNPQRQQQHQLGPYSKAFQGNPPFRERVVSNGGFYTFSESGDACSLSSSLRHHRAQEERVLSLVKASQRQQQQQMSGQGETTTSSSSLQSRGSHPACGSHPDMVSSNHHPMDRLLHNFQVGFPERALHPPGTSSFGRPDQMSHPGIPPGFRDGQWEYSAIHGGPRNGREVTHAGQWAEAAGMMSKETMPCVVMTPDSNNNGSDAFIASAAEMMPKKLCHSVIQGPLRPYCEESASPPRPRARAGRPRKKPERPNNGVSSGAAPATPVRLRSPRRCNPKKQWLKDASSEVPPDHDPWQQGGGGDPRLLQSPAGLGPPDLNGDGYAEMLRRRGFLSLHQGCPPAVAPPPHFNGIDSNGLFAHVNGGGGGGDGVHSRNARQSAVPPPPPPSLGSEGSRGSGFVAGDYVVGHYNGHLNGQLNGSYNNGQCKVNLGAVADMADKKLLQYKPRSQHARELLWAQALSLHSWPSRLKDEGAAFLPAASHGAQGKAEPERFHKTIKDDLESLHRANGIHQNGGDFNNYLEAAIENAMSELNKLTGNRDGQMDGPKSKRRRIPR